MLENQRLGMESVASRATISFDSMISVLCGGLSSIVLVARWTKVPRLARVAHDDTQAGLGKPSEATCPCPLHDTCQTWDPAEGHR